jgi:peptide/nickel transport system ATP-binding protein
MPLLDVRHLFVEFWTPAGRVRAADDVSFDMREGETLALVGETGCGKSVVAGAIIGLFSENARFKGEVIYNGQNLLKLCENEIAMIRGSEISMMFQNPSLALNPVYTIGDQVSELLRIRRGQKKGQALKGAERLLQRLGFSQPGREMRMYPFQFSGGMNQRAMIAASMALHPKLLIADEPTKGLDSRLVRDVISEIECAREMTGSSILLITHDLNLARQISDRIAIMYSGDILEIGSTDEFFQCPSHPYSKALLNSLPESGFQPIPGQSPSMIHPPRGCKFHPRCQKRSEGCSSLRPSMIQSGNRMVRCRLFA